MYSRHEFEMDEDGIVIQYGDIKRKLYSYFMNMKESFYYITPVKGLFYYNCIYEIKFNDFISRLYTKLLQNKF